MASKKSIPNTDATSATSPKRRARSASKPTIRVVSDGNGIIRLVRAKSDKLAEAHCTTIVWAAHKASDDELIEHAAAGVKVEEAGKPAPSSETAAE